MRIREILFPLWAAMSLVWLVATGLIGGSNYLELRFTDAVKLQQQAKDIRAAGMDPATVAWGGPVQVGNFVVPPVSLDAPQFWARQGAGYVKLGLALPVGLLLLIEAVVAVAAGWRRRRAAILARRDADATDAALDGAAA